MKLEDKLRFGRKLARSLIALAVLLVSSAEYAAIRTVTSNADSGVGSLRQAIEQINAGAKVNNVIRFDDSLAGQTISLETELDKITVDNLTIDASGLGLSNKVTIERSARTHRKFGIFNHDGNGTLVINNLVVRNGEVHRRLGGGGIHSSNAVNLANSIVSANESSRDGGGGVSGNIVNVINSTVSENTASDNHAGGGVAGFTVTITNSTIFRNTSGSGGGVYGRELTVTNSTIFENTATNDSAGGGIDGSTVTVTNSTIFRNTIMNGVGGGVGGSTVTVTSSTILGNAADIGGGIRGSDLTVVNSTISGNMATRNSGGIRGLAITIINSTISGNTTTNTSSYGGGICCFEMSITNSTISGNTAGNSGGIYSNFEILKLDNSLVIGNTAFYSPEIGGVYGHSSTIVSSNSTIGFTGIFAGKTLTDIFESPIDIASLPSTEGNLRLKAGSPAIDAGDNNLARYSDTIDITHDLDGNPRIQGAAVDMGAYEFVISSSGD